MADKVVTFRVVMMATAVYSLRKFAEWLKLKDFDL
jgi:hypothetical protein